MQHYTLYYPLKEQFKAADAIDLNHLRKRLMKEKWKGHVQIYSRRFNGGDEPYIGMIGKDWKGNFYYKGRNPDIAYYVTKSGAKGRRL